MRRVGCFTVLPVAFCLLLLLGSIISCSGTSGAPVNATSVTASQWVVSWGASPENANPSTENLGGSEQTFRFFFLPTIDGTQERIHLSNLFGTVPVTIGAARLAVAIAAGPAIDPSRNLPLTFNGSPSITLQAGQETVSDPVNLTYSFGEKMAVSVYLQGSFPALTQHDSQVTTNYAADPEAGDQTSDTTGAAFPTSNTEWYLLSGMDVYGAYQGTVAIFGSSSVDGHESNYGNTNSYPDANAPIATQDNDRPSDWLARDLIAAGYRVGVLNAGNIGDAAGYDSASSLAGINRMKHDVLQQAGIKTVVIYFGGIDLRSACLPATEVEGALSNMVAQAQAVGVRVMLATLPPSEYCTTSDASLLPSTANPYQGDLYPGPENPGSAERRTLNAWIRTSGAQLPGVVAIADFDQALAYPAHPDFYYPNFYSGDNFHPNGAGYGAQSAAIQLPLILPSN